MSKTDNNIESQNPQIGEDIKFSDMALSPPVQKAIKAVGYETPTPIQAQVMPYLLQGRDILGVAQTGTGKTAAFALPLLSNLNIKGKGPQILCLTPTRELAIQVAEAFQTYAKFVKGFKELPVYGGADFRGQLRQLARGVHVVVGTPGRTMDHIRRGTLMLNDVKTLVLDEADEMLNMGFIDDVEWILEQMPQQHRTALFSATMPPRIRKLTDKYLKNPAEITIALRTATAPDIRQRFLQLRNNEKLDTLARIMEVEEFDGMLVFVRTKNATLEVAQRLQARGHAAEALNGDIAQNQREKTVARLKKGDIDIIVATDVAARGLDVDRISHVVNYDVPYDTESYVHRIGRTGRAGRKGDAILFVNGREKRMLQAIERMTRQKIGHFKFPTADMLNERKMAQLFARIDATLKEDLTEYHSVVSKYLKHNDVDPVLLAAAMTSLEAGNVPFYIKDLPPPPRPERERGGREDRRDRAERRESIIIEGEEIEFETYRLEVGEVHGVSPGDIVGAIANEGGIDSQYMGKIRIYEEHSFIDLPEGMPKDIYKTLKKVWVRGKQLQISREDDKTIAEPRPRRSRDFAKKGRPGKTRPMNKIKKSKTRKARRARD